MGVSMIIKENLYIEYCGSGFISYLGWISSLPEFVMTVLLLDKPAVTLVAWCQDRFMKFLLFCQAAILVGSITGDPYIVNATLAEIKWRLWCQKQVSQAGISSYILQFTVGCNYLSLPEIPASGIKVLKYAQGCWINWRWYKPMLGKNDTFSLQHSSSLP